MKPSLPYFEVAAFALFLATSVNANAWLPLDATRFDSPHPYVGERSIQLVYEANLVSSAAGPDDPPDENYVKSHLASFVGTPYIVLDIERWEILKSQKLIPNAARNAAWYLQVLNWAHESLPGSKIAFFEMPYGMRFATLSPSRYMADYRAAMQLLTPVMAASDFLAPAFYTTWIEPTTTDWQSAEMSFARRFGKPIFPFMWHRMESANHPYAPSSEIARQCDFVRKHADGVIWWSISTEKYDPASTWRNDAAACFAH